MDLYQNYVSNGKHFQFLASAFIEFWTFAILIYELIILIHTDQVLPYIG